MKPWFSQWHGLQRPALSMAEILADVAEETGFTVEELKGQSRKHRLACARHYAMARMRAETRHSTPRIGAFLGGRHHTTVLHGLRRHAERMAEGMRIAA